MEKSPSVRFIVYAALFAALTSVGAYIAIPIGPVPIVLSNLFVLLAGLLLGPKWGSASMGLYLLLGAIGLPVFSGGKSGLTAILGPTGGYLIAYVLAAFLIALICTKGKKSLLKDIIAVTVGIIVIYLIGVPWLKINLGMSWAKAISAGMIPFLLGDILKGAAALALSKYLRPMIKD